MDKLEYVSFRYMILNGCRHHCSGCTQKRDENPPITDQDYIDLKNLYEDIIAHGGKIKEMVLTPTDFMSAANRTELMNDERLMELASYGEDFDVNLTCLDQDMHRIEDLVNDLNKLPKNVKLELGIPYEYAKRNNPKYQNHIVKTLEMLQERLNNHIYDIQFAVNYSAPTFESENKEELTLEGFKELMSREIYPGSKLDLALPDTNLDLRDLNVRSSLKKSLHGLNDLYVKIMEEDVEHNEITTVYARAMPGYTDSIALNYYDGELYLSAVSFDISFIREEIFRISKPWTYDSIILKISEVISDGLVYTEKTHDCQSCPHLINCAKVGTLSLMKIANYKDCISMLKDNSDLIQRHQELNYTQAKYFRRG